MRRLVDDQLNLLERKGRWLPYWLGFVGLVAAALLVLGVAKESLCGGCRRCRRAGFRLCDR
jgi:hypothetical protein